MSQDHHPLSPEAARSLALDTEPYLSCDDCFEHVDGFVEALLADAEYGLPALRVHLAGCGACAEEARSLICLVAEQDGLSPDAALRRLEAG